MYAITTCTSLNRQVYEGDQTMRYTVENTATEERSEHRTWSAAMRTAAKHDPNTVVITETDRDGSREYNAEGKMLRKDGHYR